MLYVLYVLGCTAAAVLSCCNFFSLLVRLAPVVMPHASAGRRSERRDPGWITVRLFGASLSSLRWRWL